VSSSYGTVGFPGIVAFRTGARTANAAPARAVCRARPPAGYVPGMTLKIFAHRVLFCAIACASATACMPQARAPEPIRVMTYNIAAGRGDLSAIADVIRAADADIIALQEVDVRWSERSGFADQATVLADALGMNVRFGPIYRLPGAGSAAPREFGLAILSRHHIVEFRNHVISRLSTQSNDTMPRPLPGFLEAVIAVGDMSVHVFNTHLDYRADPSVRMMQAAEMLDILSHVRGPLLLMGDLNAPPQATELTALRARLRDAWEGEDPGFTYPAAAPVRRIDYILFSDHFRAAGSRVIETEASDHRPVVADLTR
jgi:endonuclease/exonuclease/phosphatase family metal-dependent hydrolase